MLRKRFRPSDLALSLWVAFAMGVSLWLLARAGLVRFLDWHVHLCWLQGFSEALGEGVAYPRWIEGANQGQGGPVFLYYAPLVYYLGAALIALGGDIVTAYEGVQLLSLLLCAAGIQAWLAPHAGRRVALLLGGSALLAPQITVFAHVFNMPASALAVGLLPWLGWALERGGAAAMRVARLGGVLALVCLSHTLTAFQVLCLLGLAGVAAVLQPGTRDWALRVLLPGGLLGLALCAVYLLPMLLHRDLIHAHHLIETPQWDIAANLQFGWLWGDPHAANGPLEFDFANGLGLLALVAASWHLWRMGEQRRGWRGYAAAAAVCLLLMTPAALPLYEAFEPLRFLQFGWRWQALFLLCVMRVSAAALASSAGPEASAGVVRGRLALPLLGAICAVGLAVCMLRVMLPTALPHGGEAVARRVDATEATRFAQTCAWPMLEYRPRGMGSSWRADLRRRPREPQVISGRAHLMSALGGHHARDYVLVADLPSRVLLPVLAFPNWSLSLNGISVPARGQPDDGRIAIDLPRGRHELALRFESSLPMRTGAGISLLGLLAWLALLWRGSRSAT